MVTVPAQLYETIPVWHGEEGLRWLDALPGRIDDLARRWQLTIGEPFAGEGAVSWVAPATSADGEDAVVKVFIPDLENRQEAEALLHYGGRGAVHCLRHEPGVLLLERARPGTSLWSMADDSAACRVAIGVLRRLWRPPADRHSFRLLAADAVRWSTEILADWRGAGRPYERALAEHGADLAAWLAGSQGEGVVLHQDLHGGNILRAERDGWLAIDAKPLVGEREFDLASLIRDRRWMVTREVVLGRLDLLAGELALDRERTRSWAIVHALAWAADAGGVDETMVACARWLAEG